MSSRRIRVSFRVPVLALCRTPQKLPFPGWQPCISSQGLARAHPSDGSPHPTNQPRWLWRSALQIYGHLFKKDDRAAAMAIDAVMR